MVQQLIHFGANESEMLDRIYILQDAMEQMHATNAQLLDIIEDSGC